MRLRDRVCVRRSGVRHVGLDLLGVGVGHDRSAAVLADVLRVVADQTVALAGHASLDLARRGEFEALLGARLRLQLRHFHSLSFRGLPLFELLEPGQR
uniref:STAS domain-containing protein n=1 Tax=Parastrongyloides trichosuri TaxID=131310 RepID=A0A0N4Z852_PARTI